MRILQVSNIFSLPHGGGTVDVVYKLSRALMQRGHNVIIYTSDFEIDQEYINSLEGVKVYPFHSWFKLPGVQFYLTPGMILEAKRSLKYIQIIHMHGYRSLQNVIIYYSAKKYARPYIIDAHGSIPRTHDSILDKRRLKLLLRWLFDVTIGYKILRDASKCIAETVVGVHEYKELGVYHDKIVLITPPFTVDDFSHLPPRGLFRSKYSIKEKHIVMFLGRVNWIKGIDFLVESFYELTKYRDDVILAIVGPDDGYESTLEELIDKLNLSSRVLFTGFLGGDDKLSALVDTDVVVQTSRYEQGAWAPFEAILCNTPIIVSSNSGAGEDVRKIDAGCLVEWGNKKELRDAMQKILDDPTEAIIKTQKAKEYIIKNLSMEKNVEKYEMVYMDCIKEKGKW